MYLCVVPPSTTNTPVDAVIIEAQDQVQRLRDLLDYLVRWDERGPVARAGCS